MRVERSLAARLLPFISLLRTPLFVRLATRMHCTLLAHAGTNVSIKAGVCIDSPERVSIGDRTSIGEFTFISATGGVRIGADVLIGHHSSLITSNHRFDDAARTIASQGVVSSPIDIGDDVWIGAGVRILAGVQIGRGAVIAAGAVVTQSVDPFSVVGGVPARFIRNRGEPEPA